MTANSMAFEQAKINAKRVLEESAFVAQSQAQQAAKFEFELAKHGHLPDGTPLDNATRPQAIAEAYTRLLQIAHQERTVEPQ